MKQACLLTGPPGAGKTSLIKQVVAEYHGKACGFYTEEIRVQGNRAGFRLVTLDGKEAILSHIDFASPYRVGKYGVNVAGLEQVGVSALLQGTPECELVVVDEIGRMELFSLAFRDAILQTIASGKRMLGTVMLHHHAWSDLIKCRPEVSLIMLSRQNRQQVLAEVWQWLKEMP